MIKTRNYNLTYENSKDIKLRVTKLELWENQSNIMDTEKQEEFQDIQWTIVVQCVKEGNNPPTYKLVMNYYGEAPVPILKCESDQTEWIKEE